MSAKGLGDKVGALVLIGVAAAGVTLLGLRSRGKLPPSEPPSDPNLARIDVFANPNEIIDGQETIVSILVEGGSGQFGGDLQFGDGQIFNFQADDFNLQQDGSFLMQVPHTYSINNSNPEQLLIFLRLQDSATEILNTTSSQITIQPAVAPPPTPSQIIKGFTQSQTMGTAPLTVGFSIDPADPRSTIVWNFGDGSPQVFNQLILSHLYSAGSFNGFVEVTNSFGESERVNFSVIAQADIPPPGQEDIISNFFQSKAVINAGDEVSFSIALGAVQQSIRWNFGDGTSEILNQLAVDHRYNQAGTFGGFVEVFSVGGNSERRNFTVTVSQPPTTISLNIDLGPEAGAIIEPNEVFTLRANVGGGVPPFVNYDWDLGDGNFIFGSDKFIIGHSYPSPGKRTVTLTVRDSIGQQKTDTRVIDVKITPLDFGDISITDLGESGGFDRLFSIKNNRNDIRIDGDLNIKIFDGSTQIDSIRNFPSINPGQAVSEQLNYKSFYPVGRQLIGIIEVNERANPANLLDDLSWTFVISVPALCEANSSNAFTLATQIVNGTFFGTVPSFFVFTATVFLQGAITQQEFIDAFNDLVNRGIIVCG